MRLIFFFIFLNTFTPFKDLEATTLNLARFIELIERNDPEFKLIHSQIDALKAQTTLELPNPRLLFSVRNEIGQSSDSNNTNLLIAELSKEIIHTGTQFSLKQTKTLRPDREENLSEFRIEQSLLKNFLGSDVRLKESALNQNQQREILKIKEAYQNYLFENITLFFNFKKAHLDLTLGKEVLNEAKHLVSNVQRKFKSKIASLTDVQKCELLHISKEEELLQKKNEFEVLQSEVFQKIGLQSFAFDPNKEKELEFFGKIKQQLVEIEDINTFKIAILEEEMKSKEKTLAKRNQRATLNLVVGLNKDNSHRFSTSVNRDETVVGLKLEIPFGDHKLKSQEEIAAVALYQAKLKKENTKIILSKRMFQLKAEIKSLRDKILLAKKKVTLMKKIIKEEEKRYSFGKIDLEKIIELKNNYAQYRANYQSILIELNKSYLSWHVLTNNIENIRAQLLESI